MLATFNSPLLGDPDKDDFVKCFEYMAHFYCSAVISRRTGIIFLWAIRGSRIRHLDPKA